MVKKYSDLNMHSGTMLIVTLWILAILTVFALALGRQSSLEIKLAKYQRDMLQAEQLARAAIEWVILEKRNDTNKEIDTLNESWANNEAVFNSFQFGRGSFSLTYTLDGSVLYGMEDEQSKININQTNEQVLISLLEAVGAEDAQNTVSSIFVWSGKEEDSTGEEEDYYQGLNPSYHCKKEEFKSIPELLLVRGITLQNLYGEDKDEDGHISSEEEGIAKYLSIYGDGKVNINTASQRVLAALINDLDLVDNIVVYRKGDDGEIGTEDDKWFSEASFGAPEWEELQSFKSLFCVNSKIYTIHAQAEVKKVRRYIHAIVDLSDPDRITYLFWKKN